MNILPRHLTPALALASMVGLAACVGSQNSIVAGLQTAYIGAVDAEISYANMPSHNPAVVKQFGAYRVQAYDALQPLVAAAECTPTATTPCTSVVSAAETEAAEAAVAQLTSYLTSQGITIPATSTGAAQ